MKYKPNKAARQPAAQGTALMDKSTEILSHYVPIHSTNVHPHPGEGTWLLMKSEARL
jgi:hypothetical protein